MFIAYFDVFMNERTKSDSVHWRNVLTIITIVQKSAQTLRAGCSKAEPIIFAPPQPPPWGAGRLTFNQLEMVTTFCYKPSLVRIDVRNFELS